MWTTVHVAVGEESALEIKSKLKTMGFLVKIDNFDLEGNSELYEIIAPEFEAKEVQEAMIELGII